MLFAGAHDIHLGYLAYDAKAGEAFIPNEEVQSSFIQAVKNEGRNEVYLLLVGINYDKKARTHQCKIERWETQAQIS